KEHVNRPIVFAIDQEGGIVTRLEEGFTISPRAMAIGATNNPQNAFMAGKILGQEMRAMGITWNLAPVVDISAYF
ncbi:MAG: glycoside hydrolase family 3 N-terminal domain-containing protein, partial [Thermotogota bacterium]|nr:glycoside hydrolase family 3 N-terminal domain-containing protein [Thermotogota bacterium]